MRDMEDIMRRISYRRPVFPGVYETEMMVGKLKGHVIFSENEDGWEHVSFMPYNKNKLPSWEDMCQLKDVFWEDEEAVIQIHPKKSEYVNVVENCLHLWRNKDIPLPN